MQNVSSRCGNRDSAPRLRFPEFNGEWEEKKLGEIAERVTRKNRNNETDLPLTISSKDGLVDQVTYFNKTVASKDMSGYYLLKNGEFAYNKSYSVGYDFGSIKRLDKYPMGALSTLYICFSIKNFDSDFMKVYFDSLKWYREIYLIAAEGARNHGLLNISTEDFFETKHKLPLGLPEQERIAAFFTLLDRRIQKQRQLVEYLKTYKRGVMNKLFDENIEFDKYLKWEKVDEIFKTINDKPYQVQSCSYFQNGLYDIVDQGKKEIVGFCDYNDKLFIDVPVIIYGDHTTLVKYREKKFIVGGDGVKLLKSRDSNINLKYLYYALLRYNIKLEGYKRHFSILKEVSLPIFEKCIQDEIAKIMTCIDSYIKLHENKLSSLLSLKSSLLQKMFI